jgi:transposase
MIKSKYEKCITRFWLGRVCIFCHSRKVCTTARRYVKCLSCTKQKSLRKLRYELAILLCFAEQRPASQVNIEYGITYKVVASIYRKMRYLLYHQCELEGSNLSGEIEIDEAWFGGKKKGTVKGRAPGSKSVVLGILERKGQVYTKIVHSRTAYSLMQIIKERTTKGSVYYTDNFRSYNSLYQYGNHRKVNHSKTYVTPRHNHINGIEGFWSYCKHKLYNYRGVSKANFPLYLKEMEYRFNHRSDNLLLLLKNLYFSYETL